MNWISVQDSLPPFGKNVFTLFYPKNPVMEGLHPGVDYRRDIAGTSIELIPRLAENVQQNNGFNQRVAFWMEIPETPKTTKN
jgi:hypothetical protein